MKNQEFSDEEIDKILSAIENNQSPFLDIEDIEDIFDILAEDRDVDSADILSQYALKLYPESSSIILIRVSTLIDLHRLSEAETLLQYLEKIDSDNPDISVYYGYISLRKGNENDACKYFEKAIEACDDDEYQHINKEIGLNLNMMGHFDMAMSFLTRYLEQNPDDDSVMFEKAYALEKLGKLEESIEEYEKLLKTNPFQDMAWFNLGILYSMKNDDENAINAYKTAISIRPDYPEPHFNLGNIYFSRNDYYAALFHYTEYASLYDNYLRENVVFQFIGECWNELHILDLAQRSFKLALEYLPDDADAWYGLAINHLKSFEPKEAIVNLNRAIDIDPDVADYYFTRADALSILNGNTDKERFQDLFTGLRLQPELVRAWIKLIKIVMCENDGMIVDTQTPLLLIKEVRKDFESTPAIDFVEAIILAVSHEGVDAKAKKLMQKVLKESPETITEALKDIVVRATVKTTDDFYGVLKDFNK